MIYATLAQAQAAGFVLVKKTDGQPYANLLEHGLAPGILFRLLTIADDVNLFRGFAAITTGTGSTVGTKPNTVLLGAGRYRQQAIDGTIGVWGPGARYINNGEPLPASMGTGGYFDGSPQVQHSYTQQPQQMYTIDANLATWETNQQGKVHLAMLVPSGDVIGILNKGNWRKDTVSSTDSVFLDASVRRSQPPNHLEPIDVAAGNSPALSVLLDKPAKVVTAPGYNTSGWGSFVIVRAVLKFGGLTQKQQIKRALDSLADSLPDDVPQDKVTRWRELAEMALTSRPDYLVPTDEKDAEIYWTLSSLNGQPLRDIQTFWNINRGKPNLIKNTFTEPLSKSGQVFYTVGTSTTQMTGDLHHRTPIPLVFNGCLLEYFSSTVEEAVPTALAVNGQSWPIAKLLGQTAVLMNPPTGVFPTDVKAQLDPTTLPTTPITESSVELRRAKLRANEDYDAECVFVKHGPVVASVQYAMVEADRGIK